MEQSNCGNPTTHSSSANNISQGNFKMEQQNIPNTQIVYLTQAPKEKRDKDLKDAYNVKATRILGVVHIVCGLIAFSSEIQVIENGYHRDVIGIGTGIWTSVFFFVSGGLSIRGAQSGSKRLVVSTMVMSILSAVCAGVLLIMSSLGWTIHSSNCNFNYSRCSVDASVTSYVRLILMGLIMLIVAIVSAALTCKPLCCRSVKQESPHHNQYNNQAHYHPIQAYYHHNQGYYQLNQAPHHPCQVNNHALYHPNQVQYQVNTTSTIPNSDQAAALNHNLHVQPATKDKVSQSSGCLFIE